MKAYLCVGATAIEMFETIDEAVIYFNKLHQYDFYIVPNRSPDGTIDYWIVETNEIGLVTENELD